MTLFQAYFAVRRTSEYLEIDGDRKAVIVWRDKPDGTREIRAAYPL